MHRNVKQSNRMVCFGYANCVCVCVALSGCHLCAAILNNNNNDQTPLVLMRDGDQFKSSSCVSARCTGIITTYVSAWVCVCSLTAIVRRVYVNGVNFICDLSRPTIQHWAIKQFSHIQYKILNASGMMCFVIKRMRRCELYVWLDGYVCGMCGQVRENGRCNFIVHTNLVDGSMIAMHFCMHCIIQIRILHHRKISES